MRDILQTADGDIDFTGDDFVLAPTERATGQHKRDILLAAPGDFKEAPTLGVAAVEYIQDDAELFLRNVRKQMQEDGMNITRVAFNRERYHLFLKYKLLNCCCRIRRIGDSFA